MQWSVLYSLFFIGCSPIHAKDFVLAEKPVISDDSNLLDPPLLDELLANIGGARYSVSPTHEIDNRESPPPNANIAPHASVRPPVPAAPKGHFLDLMWDGDSSNNSIVSLDQPKMLDVNFLISTPGKWNVPDKDLERLHLPLMVTHKDNEEKLTTAFTVLVGGVFCEIVDEDGSMARLPKLQEFANKENIKDCVNR
ncbi:hypothetical protein AgCh_035237 [Apium graveolens]